MKLLQIKSISLLLIVFVTLSQTACVDLAGLRKFTDSSVEAGSKFKGIMSDSYRSCAMELYYIKAETDNFNNLTPFVSAKEFLDANPSEGGQLCETSKQNAKNFIFANKVLMTYLYVMGQLAGDGLTNTDDEFDKLKTAFGQIPGGGDPLVATSFNLANTITNIIVQSKQQKALKETISQNNGNITSLTNGLSTLLDTYLTRLAAEKNRLKQMYGQANQLHITFNRRNRQSENSLNRIEDLIKTIPGVRPQAQPIQNNAEMLNPDYDALQVLNSNAALETEIKNIDAKIGAAEAYKEVLSSIQQGHQDLYVEANKGFKKKEAIRIALKYAPSIQKNYDEIIKVF